MKFKKGLYAVIASICSILVVSGYAPAARANISHQQVVHSRTRHADGTIASMKLVTYPRQSTQLNMYEIFYWSQGVQLEMYALVPKTETNWLIVNCHGGWVFPGMTPRTTPYTLAEVAADHYTNAVTIFPAYSGYGGSQGDVKGISSNAIDVDNAISAIQSLKELHIQYISDDGVSMGGAVALMIASQGRYSNEIAHVILNSPFPGFEVAETWDEENTTSTIPGADHERAIQNYSVGVYGPFSPSTKPYLINSPDLSKIKVPVLIVQGTNDQEVPWTMSRMLYRDLKQDGVNVTFDLVKGGNHGLTGKYASTLDNDVNTWLLGQ